MTTTGGRVAPPVAGSDADRPRITYVPALDGLRGAAVIAVVVFHVGHLRGGFLGVDLFFVLSGFLITSLLLVEGGATERIRLGRFWARRARRLLPALGVLLVGVAAYARWVAYPSELHGIRWDGIATIFYVANWRQVFTEASYWMLFVSPSPLDHTWSLAIEEQFYLVWPLIFVVLVALARRREPSRRRLATFTLVVCGVAGVASLVTALVLVGGSGWDRVYFGTDTRAFAILAGAALAALTVRVGHVPSGRPRQALEVGGLVGMVVLAVAWTRITETSWLLHHGGLASCSLAGAVVIAAAVHPDRGILARVFAWGPLRWIGLISYGIYLYHWPIIVWLSRDRTGLDGWALIGLQVTVTLAVSALSYVAIEQPIRHGTGWRPATTVVVAGGAFVVVTALVGLGTRGFLPLDAPRVAGPGTTVAASPQGARILVIGDSVADFVAAEGMTYLRADPQPTVENLTVEGCSEPPTDQLRFRDGTTTGKFVIHCDDGWDDEIRSFRPDYVILQTVGGADAERRHGDEWLHPCSPGYRDWVVDRIDTLAATVDAADGTLVLVTAVPEDARLRDDGEYRRYKDANACWNDALRAAARNAPSRIELVDLADQFCTEDRTCVLHTSDGSIGREDGGHFRGRAAAIVARIIYEQLGIPAALP